MANAQYILIEVQDGNELPTRIIDSNEAAFVKESEYFCDLLGRTRPAGNRESEQLQERRVCYRIDATARDVAAERSAAVKAVLAACSGAELVALRIVAPRLSPVGPLAASAFVGELLQNCAKMTDVQALILSTREMLDNVARQPLESGGGRGPDIICLTDEGHVYAYPNYSKVAERVDGERHRIQFGLLSNDPELHVRVHMHTTPGLYARASVADEFTEFEWDLSDAVEALTELILRWYRKLATTSEDVTIFYIESSKGSWLRDSINRMRESLGMDPPPKVVEIRRQTDGEYHFMSWTNPGAPTPGCLIMPMVDNGHDLNDARTLLIDAGVVLNDDVFAALTTQGQRDSGDFVTSASGTFEYGIRVAQRHLALEREPETVNLLRNPPDHGLDYLFAPEEFWSLVARKGVIPERADEKHGQRSNEPLMVPNFSRVLSDGGGFVAKSLVTAIDSVVGLDAKEVALLLPGGDLATSLLCEIFQRLGYRSRTVPRSLMRIASQLDHDEFWEVPGCACIADIYDNRTKAIVILDEFLVTGNSFKQLDAVGRHFQLGAPALALAIFDSDYPHVVTTDLGIEYRALYGWRQNQKPELTGDVQETYRKWFVELLKDARLDVATKSAVLSDFASKCGTDALGGGGGKISFEVVEPFLPSSLLWLRDLAAGPEAGPDQGDGSSQGDVVAASIDVSEGGKKRRPGLKF